jgi:hypothetical protein
MKNKVLKQSAGGEKLGRPISTKEIAPSAFCKICGKEFYFIKFGHARIYCSPDCYWFAKEQQNPWYIKWDTVRKRCSYKSGLYAIKGIKNLLTCEDVKFLWFRDKAYLMKKPSIDRINTKGNYEIRNCRFIELSENCRQGGLSAKRLGVGIFRKVSHG